MNNATIVTLALGAPTIVLGLFSLLHTVRQANRRRYLENARGLFELHSALMDRGPISGLHASKSAVHSHEALLESIDENARANTHYFNQTSMVLGGGSFPTAISLIVYGLVVSIVATVNSIGRPLSPADLVTAGCVLLIGLIVAGVGWSKLIRRRGQRRARGAIGVIDSSTIEGITVAATQAQRIFSRLRIRPRKPTASADPN